MIVGILAAVYMLGAIFFGWFAYAACSWDSPAPWYAHVGLWSFVVAMALFWPLFLIWGIIGALKA